MSSCARSLDDAVRLTDADTWETVVHLPRQAHMDGKAGIAVTCPSWYWHVR